MVESAHMRFEFYYKFISLSINHTACLTGLYNVDIKEELFCH